MVINKILITNVLVRTPVCKQTASSGSQGKMCRAGFVQLLIAKVLVRTPICKPTASPGSQEKMCREGFLQLLIANVLDRTPVCKVRAMVFPLKSRENSQRRICASLQRKRLFWMTRVQPRTNNLLRFTSVILGMFPFVKLERLAFVPKRSFLKVSFCLDSV